MKWYYARTLLQCIPKLAWLGFAVEYVKFEPM